MFETCHSAEDCKKRYRQLAIELHPDKQGGNTAAFQEMQKEYEKRLCELQTKTPTGSKEAMELAKALLEILRITKPEYYEMLKMAIATNTVNVLATAFGNLFPTKKETLTKFLNLLD